MDRTNDSITRSYPPAATPEVTGEPRCNWCGGSPDQPATITTGSLSYLCTDWFHVPEGDAPEDGEVLTDSDLRVLFRRLNDVRGDDEKRIVYEEVISNAYAALRSRLRKAEEHYVAAVNGRREFRAAYREVRAERDESNAAGNRLSSDLRAALERVRVLEETVLELRRGTCWCECGIGNPMMRGEHSDTCNNVRELLEVSQCNTPKIDRLWSLVTELDESGDIRGMMDYSGRRGPPGVGYAHVTIDGHRFIIDVSAAQESIGEK